MPEQDRQTKFEGYFGHMALDAVTLANHMLAVRRRERGDDLDDRVFSRDLVDLAAHLLTIPLDREAARGKLPEAIERFRSTFRKAIEHENLPLGMLAVLGNTDV